MSDNRTKNNRLRERCLSLLYNDKKSCFHDLLEKDGSVSIHYWNVRALATEMYRISNRMVPEIVTEISPLRPQGQYNLRSWFDFTLPFLRTVNYGIESTRYLGPKIWEIVPANIKEVNTIERFKSGIKKWKPEPCPCRLCKMYLQ